MSNYFLGQIMMTGFGYSQRGFIGCNGSLLSINQFQALFSLLGTQYGGDGITNFGVPDLRGRAPVGAGSSVDQSWNPAPYGQGTVAGSESVTLTTGNLPTHVHGARAASGLATAGLPQPDGSLARASGSNNLYAPSGANYVIMAPGTVGPAGASAPHANRQPLLAINFNLATVGIYPSRN